MSTTGADERGSTATDASTVRRWRDLLASEREAAELYDRLAEAAQGERGEILRELAAVERRHAAHWEERLRSAGQAVPPVGRPGLRTRLLTTTARRVSLDAVLPLIERAEKSDAGQYDTDPDAAAGMAADERGHARALAAMRGGGSDDAQGRIGRREPWHRGDRSGALRAAIFGVSDGPGVEHGARHGVRRVGRLPVDRLLAGVAGLLAGSFSMAAGEYVSMSGQREMFEREIALEARELEEKPEEELEELVLIYRAKGMPAAQARQVAESIMRDRDVALDTLAREELGLDPDALGSPWSAALSSLLAFAVGAFVVVVPYLVTGGADAFVAAVVLSLLGMTAIGAGIGLLNGRSPVRSALRQVVVGVLAAGVTYGVGALIGIRAG